MQWSGGEPVGVDLTVEVSSLEVLRGEGGVKGLSGPEKALARSNALSVLDADKFPQIHFQADDIEKTDDVYRIAGTLEIHGKAREHVIDLRVEDLGDRWRMSCEAEVRHSEFGLKPYSMFLGSMKVVDTVTMSFTADRAKERTDSVAQVSALRAVAPCRCTPALVELAGFVHEGLMPGLLEPENLFDGRGQHVEVRDARFGRHPVIATAEEEEDGHAQRGCGLQEVERATSSHIAFDREPEAAVLAAADRDGRTRRRRGDTVRISTSAFGLS